MSCPFVLIILICLVRLLQFCVAKTSFGSNISNMIDSVASGYPNTEKRVENTTCSGVVLTKFKVFGNWKKHCLKCLIYLLNQNKN